MTRRAPRWPLVPLVAAVAAAGCARRLDEGGGTIRLALNVAPGGPSVSSAHWQIVSASSVVVKAGDIDVADVNATASVDTSCPAGSGDRVVLSATASDGTACTGQSAPFDVVAGGSVMVGVVLVCGGGVPMQPNGSVVIGGQVVAGDNCPVLTSWEASPLVASSGQLINVSVTATDADVGQKLTYAWTADSGNFAAPSAAVTTYTCGAPTLIFYDPAPLRLESPHTVTVTVFDDFTPTPCTTSVSFPVDCVGEGGPCGDGIVDSPDEECDPPNGTNCNAFCRHVVFCGDGIVEGSEQCDPPSAANHCSSTCQRIPYCGDGIVTAPEQCDPPGVTFPDGTACGPSCTLMCVAATAANTCTTCERADPLDCPASLNVVPGTACDAWGCDGFSSAAAQTDCRALLACIRTQHCAIGDDPTPCLSPCAAEYTWAASHASGTVLSQFHDPHTPVGIANNQAACAVDSRCPCP